MLPFVAYLENPSGKSQHHRTVATSTRRAFTCGSRIIVYNTLSFAIGLNVFMCQDRPATLP